MNYEIEKPGHYVDGRCIEITKLIEDWGLGWHLGNVMKYIARAGRKDDEIQDMRKGLWYLGRKVALGPFDGDCRHTRSSKNFTAEDVIADWDLPGHLAGVVIFISNYDGLDDWRLNEARGLLAQYIGILKARQEARKAEGLTGIGIGDGDGTGL